MREVVAVVLPIFTDETPERLSNWPRITQQVTAEPGFRHSLAFRHTPGSSPLLFAASQSIGQVIVVTHVEGVRVVLGVEPAAAAS